MKRLAIIWICQILSCYPFECFLQIVFVKIQRAPLSNAFNTGWSSIYVIGLSKFDVDYYFALAIPSEKKSLFQIKNGPSHRYSLQGVCNDKLTHPVYTKVSIFIYCISAQSQ